MITSQIILRQIGEEFISNIKKCHGDISGTHANLRGNVKCAGCNATAELLSLIRVKENT